jgi:3-hydroxymyristoyl/3-hydroxydecanoyl-(acyl carrier protein) dehydratase
MSLIQQGILQAMTDLEAFEADGFSACFSFPEEFAGFQGHFKNNPVLPGICKVHAVVAMTAAFHRQEYRLIEVSQAKFFLPVTCNQNITIQCHSKISGEGLRSVKALVKREEEKIALLQLTVRA